MQNFAVRLELASGIVIGHRMCGDGLVAGVLYEALGGDWEAALVGMRRMIEHTKEGVPKASQIIIEGLGSSARICKIGSHHWEDDKANPDCFKFLKDQDVKPGTLKNKEETMWTEYTVINPKAVWFLFRGDKIALADFFSMIRKQYVRIGGRRHTGDHGVVSNSTIIDSTSDDELFGIIAKGQLMRPFPMELPLREGTEKLSGANETWECPYYSKNKTKVHIPLRNPFIVTSRDMGIMVR